MTSQALSTQTASIRRATERDVPAITRMLGRAFFEDPVIVWACNSTARRPALLQAIDHARVRQLLAYGEIWITTDATSAALWTPPGEAAVNFAQKLALARGLLRPRLATPLPRLALALSRMRGMHFEEPPHWYLSRLGTEPHLQGRGLASAALQPVLKRCDDDRIGAYLETAVERNLSFYAHHGFRVRDELRLPAGPMIRSMWREPQARKQAPNQALDC
jgi:GNAT superfamily N-acetyltransferase